MPKLKKIFQPISVIVIDSCVLVTFFTFSIFRKVKLETSDLIWSTFENIFLTYYLVLMTYISCGRHLHTCFDRIRLVIFFEYMSEFTFTCHLFSHFDFHSQFHYYQWADKSFFPCLWYIYIYKFWIYVVAGVLYIMLHSTFVFYPHTICKSFFFNHIVALG